MDFQTWPLQIRGTTAVEEPIPQWRSPGSECRMQANREWVRSQLQRMTSIPSPRSAHTAHTAHTAHDAAGISVDTNTLKWKSWVGQPPDDGEVDVPEPGAPYKLTQTEFRRLHDQVREVSGQPPSGRPRRGSGFKKFVTNDQGLTTPVVHRSQLASSFRAFHDKRWRPYEGGSGREVGDGSAPPSRTSSRLSSSRPSSCGSVRSDQRLLDKRSHSSIGHRSPVTGRPRTGVDTPGGSYRHPANVYGHPPTDPSPHHQGSPLRGAGLQGRGSQSDLTDGGCTGDQTKVNLVSYSSQTSLTRQGSAPNLAPLPKTKASMTPAATEITKPSDHLGLAYDTLTPEIIYQLSAGPRPLSVYGSRPTRYRPEVGVSRTRSEKEEDSPLPVSPPVAEDGDQTSPGSGKRDTDSTSGIGTDKDSDVEEDELEDDDDDGDHDSNDSDDERIPEPKLEDIKMADLPRLNLRPEQLDAMYIPDQRHDRRRYDFDSNKCEVIPYEFKDALSPPLMALDLHQASLSDRHWRSFAKGPASDATEEKIVERLLELEALQRKTKEVETLRRDRLRSAHVRARSRVGATTRQQSAKLGERKCCADCLQVACVGDCPGKRSNPLQRLGSSNCLICAERDCDGSCCQSAYDARSRQARVPEEEPKRTNRFRPRSCTSCTSSKNPSKTTNANNILLYRPKSSYSTFSSSQNSSSRPTKDLRPKGGQVGPQLEDEFERLGIDTEPDHQGAAAGEKQSASGTRRKLKGRASQLPGKSFFSQRRHSLTDIAKEMRVKSANKKRLKGGKKKASKTGSET